MSKAILVVFIFAVLFVAKMQKAAAKTTNAAEDNLNSMCEAVLQLWPKFYDPYSFTSAALNAYKKYHKLVQSYQMTSHRRAKELQLAKLQSDMQALNSVLIVLRNMFRKLYWTLNDDDEEVSGAFGNNHDCKTYSITVSANKYTFSVSVVIETENPWTLRMRKVKKNITTMSELCDAVRAGCRMITLMADLKLI
jgi:hypothetical protein